MNAILALIIANVIWGAAAPIFKYALGNIPPFTLAFIRFFGAAMIIIPFLGKSTYKIGTKDYLEICLSAFFGITVNIAFFFLGLKMATSINAPIIASSGPVILYLLSIILLKEKPRLKVFTGMMVALLGVGFIILSPIILDGKQLALGEIRGNIYFVLSMIGAVLNTVINKNVLKRVDPMRVSFIGFLFSSLTFIPFMIPELGQWNFSMLDQRGLLGIIYGIFFSSALAYTLSNWALKKIDAEEVGLFTYIDPVAAILLAAPLVHEYPTLPFAVGSVLVFGGIFLAENRIHWHPLHKLKKYNSAFKNPRQQ